MKKTDPSDFDTKVALKWLNEVLKTMKKGLSNVDAFFEKNNINPEKIHIPQEKVNYMHDMTKEIEELVHNYEDSLDWVDFNTVCSKLEFLEPAFELNYGEICQNAEQAGYSFNF